MARAIQAKRKTDNMPRTKRTSRRNRHIERALVGAASLAFFASACDLPFEPLPNTEAASIVIPDAIGQLCSPIFRDVDIVSIVVELDAIERTGLGKSEAIASAADTCSDGADDLLDIADEEESAFVFTALDASVWQADCINCYIAIIDDIFDD